MAIDIPFPKNILAVSPESECSHPQGTAHTYIHCLKSGTALVELDIIHESIKQFRPFHVYIFT